MKRLLNLWGLFTRQTSSALAIALVMTTLHACIEEPEPADGDPTDTQDIALDAAEEFYNDDPEDLAQVVLISAIGSNGRTKADDHRLDCATITKNGTEESGAITVDFGTGCADMRGHIRKGKLVIVYNGHWSAPGSSWTVTFDNYSVNDIKITGDRSITNVTEAGSQNLRFSIFMQSAGLQWPDGDIATRSVEKYREVELDDEDVIQRVIITGSIEGINRLERTYRIDINESLIYRRPCALTGVFLPVSGVKVISLGEREITVDYGDSECDNIMTLTNKAGKTWTLTVNP